MTMLRLNLGCGNSRLDGWVNVDLSATCADELVDLDVYPWPWPDGAAEAVYMSHVLEHLIDPRRAMREIHRILQPGGTATVIVPHWRSWQAVHPSHLHYFSRNGFLYWHIGVTSHPTCSEPLFEPVELRLEFSPKQFLQPIWWKLADVIDWIANKWPTKWEMLGLPTGQVIWVGRKPKPQ